jgi:hypothetical protein
MNKDGFQSLLGKILYGIFALLTSFVRVFAFVLYFAISIGLFNLLAHYKYEASGFQWEEEELRNVQCKKTQPYTSVFCTNVTFQYEQNISVEKYTGFSMKDYYILFLIGMLLHFLVIFVKELKQNKPKNSKPHQGTLNGIKLDSINNNELSLKPSILDGYKHSRGLSEYDWFSSFFRAFTSFVMPEVSKDWDEDTNTDMHQDEDKNIVKVY